MADTRVLLGQVFTPRSVAALTLALGRDGGLGATVLDPSCGDGAFLEGALTAGVPGEDLGGIELDGRVAALAAARAPGANVRVHDFFEGEAPSAELVVGNPPWVRQERVAARTKLRIREALGRDWSEAPTAVLDRLVGRGDLAIAFVARALACVPAGGRVAFVMSQAVLDADYGEALFAFLAGRAHVVGIVVSPEERWFPDAAVHGMILVVERVGKRPAPAPVVARLNMGIKHAAEVVTGWDSLYRVADVQPLDLAHRGSSLRAPGFWGAVTHELTTLGSLADVRRGITSGANSFFYLSRAQAHEGGLETHTRPLMKSPQEVRRIRPRADELEHRVLCLGIDDFSSAHVAAHVAAHAGVKERPSLAGRQPWWQLPAREGRLFLCKAYDTRFVQPFVNEPMLADQRFYVVDPRVDAELLAAALNSSLGALAISVTGRSSMGQGALELAVNDAARLPVLDVRRGSRRQLDLVRTCFRAVTDQPVDSVFTMVATAERQALDAAVLGAFAPELCSHAAAIREALTGLVTQRLSRSQGATLGSRRAMRHTPAASQTAPRSVRSTTDSGTLPGLDSSQLTPAISRA